MNPIKWYNDLLRRDFHREFSNLGDPDTAWYVAGWFLAALILFLLTIIIVAIINGIYSRIDKRRGRWASIAGTIVEKIHLPDAYRQSEQFIFMVETTGKGVEKIFVEPEQYYKYQEQTVIPFWQLIGGLSKKPLGNKLNLDAAEIAQRDRNMA